MLEYFQDSLEGYFGERRVNGDVPSLDSGNYRRAIFTIMPERSVKPGHGIPRIEQSQGQEIAINQSPVRIELFPDE